MLTNEAAYLAVCARDARFDGVFFTAVTSTGIYCRPVCRARIAAARNCRFFEHAAQAEHAGFRPCLLCRPELAPGLWNATDAALMLGTHAAKLFTQVMAADGTPNSPLAVSAKLGISSRHLRRIFEQQFGLSPLQYWTTQRLLYAKRLLADSNFTIASVARLAGFGSVRQFNAVFLARYRLNPTTLIRQSERQSLGSARNKSIENLPMPATLKTKLYARPPYNVTHMLQFFAQRAIPGVEHVDLATRTLLKTLRIAVQGQPVHIGCVRIQFHETEPWCSLELSESLQNCLPQIVQRVRAMLDLEADIASINRHLKAMFPSEDAQGMRVPGTLDGFETAVRAILGQQVTVAAARTFSARVAEKFGSPLNDKNNLVSGQFSPHLTHVFPDAKTLAAASGDALGALGIVSQRQRAIIALSQAVASGEIKLDADANDHGSSVHREQTIARLLQCPGIGDWTAQYIAMRVLRWPDAFPAGDIALQKILNVAKSSRAVRETEALSQPWRPWRSYAVLRTWAGLAVVMNSATQTKKL
jgi:AraC family transcriptional regulator, regulatory protein of adaptative response / DNA-3-methyladenine glycosylase II